VFKFTYFDDRVESMLSDKGILWDNELKEELSPVLARLKLCGEVEGASCGVKPGVMGLVYELRGKTFHLTYAIGSDKKEVRFYEFQPVSHAIDWKAALEQDCHIGEDEGYYIPQIGDQKKYLRAIDLIANGINTSIALGVAFESKAKKGEYIARRGDYLLRPLMAFGLANRCQSENTHSSVYVLTERGNYIARSDDQDTRERLLVEALLGFYPIQVIIEETTRGNKELTKALIQEVISLVSLGDCGGETNPRRADSLRSLVKWVARCAGIPIRREGNDGVQLYIPHIYAN
jgi:hypothetical protein